jgi:hypothetical protein
VNEFSSAKDTSKNGEAAPETTAPDAKPTALDAAALRARIRQLGPDAITEIARSTKTSAHTPEAQIRLFRDGLKSLSPNKLAALIKAVSAVEATRAATPAGEAGNKSKDRETAPNSHADTTTAEIGAVALGGFRATWARTANNARIGKIKTRSGKWPVTPGAQSKSYIFEVREYPSIVGFYADLKARRKSGIWALIAGELHPDLDPNKPHQRVGANFIDAASTKFTIDFDGLEPDDADTPIDGADAFEGDNCDGEAVSVALARLPKAFEQAACMVSATSSTGENPISTGKPSEGKARFRATWEMTRALTCRQKKRVATALKARPGLGCIDNGGFYTPPGFDFITRTEPLEGETDPIANPVYLLEGGSLDIDAVCIELGIDLNAAGNNDQPRSGGPTPGSGRPLTADEALALYLSHKQANPLLHALADSVVNGPWFDDRPHWIGYAHTARNVFGRDVGWMKFDEFNKRRIGADGQPVENDPVADKTAFDTLRDSQNDVWDLVGYAREHGGEAGRAAYYDFVFPDLTAEEEAEIKTAEEAADLTNMDRMARFKRALRYDQRHAPSALRMRIFDMGPSGFITFGGNYLPTIGTITPRVAPWLFRNEVTSKVAGPATGKTTHVVLTAVAIAAERPDILGLKDGELKRFGDCILFCNEDPTAKTHNQILAVLKTFGLTKKDLKHNIHVEPDKFVLVTPSGNRGAAEPSDAAIRIARKIARVRERAEIAYIGLDTLLSMAGSVGTSGPEGIMPILEMAYSIASAVGCAVEVLHHLSKLGGKVAPSDMMSALGSMSLPGTVRGAIHLLTIEDDEAKRYGWPPEKALQVVKQIEAKNSNAKKGAAQARFYEWRSVSIISEDPSDPNAADGFDTEDVGVLVPMASPTVRQVTAEEALAALHQAQGAGRKIRRGGGRGRKSGDEAHSILAGAFGLDRGAAEAVIADLIKNHCVTTKSSKARGNLVEFLLLPPMPDAGDEAV